MVHSRLNPLGRGLDLRALQAMYRAFAVHRLPGGQQQDELAGHAGLATAEALAEPGLWRHHLPGADDSRRERADDAGGSGRGYVVLGAGAELKERGAAGQPLFADCFLEVGETVGFEGGNLRKQY